VRIQTVDPSAFEMPDAPANEAGVLFIFEGGLLGGHEAPVLSAGAATKFLDAS
jgi:hypothetical protein